MKNYITLVILYIWHAIYGINFSYHFITIGIPQSQIRACVRVHTLLLHTINSAFMQVACIAIINQDYDAEIIFIHSFNYQWIVPYLTSPQLQLHTYIATYLETMIQSRLVQKNRQFFFSKFPCEIFLEQNLEIAHREFIFSIEITQEKNFFNSENISQGILKKFGFSEPVYS